MGENSNSTLIGLTNPESITISVDEKYAHVYLGFGVGTLIFHSKEAAQKLAELSLEAMARLVLQEKLKQRPHS